MPKHTRAIDGLNSAARAELRKLGNNIKIARKRRKLSIQVLAERMMVSPPTVSELEKGNPRVSLGIFIQALSALGLERGFSEIIAPEADKVGMGLEVRRHMGSRSPKKGSSEKDLDF